MGVSGDDTPVTDWPLRSPYPDVDGWYWLDANKYRHGPHEHETAALRAMLEHIEQQRKWRENADARRALRPKT